MSQDHVPKVPLPTTAQFNTTIEAIRNAPTRLRPLANPISWLRDRLDPLHALEQADKEELGPLSADDSDEGWDKMDKEITQGETIVPPIAGQPRPRKSKPSITTNRNEDVPDMDGGAEDKSWDIMNRTFRHVNLGPEKQPLPQERKDHHSLKRRVPSAGRTSEKNKSSEVQGQRDKQYQKKESKTRTENVQGSERTYRGDKPAQKQQQDLLQRPHEKKVHPDLEEQEVMEVPTVIPDSPSLKVRPHLAEEERIAQELAEAMDAEHFKVWPRNPSPPRSEVPINIKESIEYQAPLDKEQKVRKQQLLEEWAKKEERDIEGRRRVRGGYEDELEKNALKSTDMFTPTLAPYIGTGKKIPTREEVLDEYESASSGEYVDAAEFLPRESRYFKGKDNKEKTKTGNKMDIEKRLRDRKEKSTNEKEKTQKKVDNPRNKPSQPNDPERKSTTRDIVDRKPKFPPDQNP